MRDLHHTRGSASGYHNDRGGQIGGDEERGQERDRYNERDRSRGWQCGADSARDRERDLNLESILPGLRVFKPGRILELTKIILNTRKYTKPSVECFAIVVRGALRFTGSMASHFQRLELLHLLRATLCGCVRKQRVICVCKTHTRAGLYLVLYTHQKEQLITNDIAQPCSNGDIDDSTR